ncbi:uncharacterized protein LOC121660875 isoform X6 [Corvus kubaryi]|uniref:uncharacterized protein LOC121660875 isoform X6 n=1 Tax=Corvus kubaryi TaxID=68294 RepID=UPI001C044AAA|nr:uncharacterized protein LOC121660875 isoform X6 [Corvus kubaryi]
MRTCKNAKTARGFCPYNSRASIFAVLGLSLSVSILFCQDAEGLNPWQSALDQVRGFPQEGDQAGSQPSRSSAAAAALDMPRNRDNELFSGPPLESDEDLRYREQLQSQSLEAASSHQNRPWGLYQHPWRLCVHFHRGWILSARLPKAKCWDRWWGQGKTLWNCRRPFEVSLEERAVAG